MKKFIIGLFLMLASLQLKAENGTISGKVISGDGNAVFDARITISGLKDTFKTDMEGHYSIGLPAGKYLVSVEHENFGSFSDSVHIKNGEETYFNVVLNTQKKIKDIDITVNRKPKTNTTEWAVQQKISSGPVVEAIGDQQIKKTTANNSGDVIKLIPGATIMDGKFANIRGMFDRYNAGYLNGAPLPSTESDRKAFSFDIIPASLLDNIVVIKSGTPDLIGDFGGGIIRINTKNIPDKLTQNFNFGFQYNSITTFKNVQEFPTYGSEFLGITPKERRLPDLSGAMTSNKSAEFLQTETQKFNNDWTYSNKKPMPSPRFSYSLGVPFKFKGGRELGILVSLNYTLTQKFSEGFVTRNDLGDNRTISQFNDALYTNNVQSGGIANFSYKLNKRNRIDWKNLYTLTYGTSSTKRTGLANADDGISSEAYSSLVNSNRLASTQLNGTHLLGKKQHTFTWLLNYGNTLRQIPDFRIAQYAIVDGERSLSFNDFFNNGSGRFFSDLKENTLSSSADMLHKLNIPLLGRVSTNLKYGLFYQSRERQFSSRNFVYGPNSYMVSNKTVSEDFSAQGLSERHVYLIEKTSSDKDEYKGNSQLKAAYAMLENTVPMFKNNGKVHNMRIIYGARMESFSQKLTNSYFDKYLKKPLANTGITNDLLPSINVITPLTGKTAVRAAYYKTVNRPEMREMAPFAFYNFNLNSEILGNTKLSRAVLHNYDIRFEIYGNKEEMISIGGFAKKILNPIEFSLDVTQPGIRTFNYQNEKSALIYGTEIEIRKNLGFISKTAAGGLFKNLNFYANYAWIHSKVQFKEGSSSMANRPLQGQSPYVTNVSMFYENKKGFQVNVNFNKIGSRIAYIGVEKKVQPYGSDIYEYGRAIFDLQVSKTFKHSSLKITGGDLFHQNTVFYQDLNNNHKYDQKSDNTLFRFTNGSTVTITYGYNF